MTDYVLRLDLPNGAVRPLTVTGETPAELAAAVHRHARPRLGSRTVDVQFDAETLTGSVWRTGTLAGTFTLEPVTEPEPAAVGDPGAVDHVAHGYTMRDLGRAARAACAADRTLSSDVVTRYDVAWSAIAEHLCAAQVRPSWDELVRAGWQAIYREVREVGRLYGVDRQERSGQVGSAPRFAAYWTGGRMRTESAAEALVERMAVWQVLGTLGQAQREAVVALAVEDDYQAAADMLGIRYGTLTARLRTGRARFRVRWFAPETAPPSRGTDRRVGSRTQSDHCPSGHEYTPENTVRRPSSRGRLCRECERLRGLARSARRRAGREGVAA